MVDDEKFFAERGFGLKLGYGERPAVAVVDIIKGFTNPDMPLGSNLDNVVAKTNEILVQIQNDESVPAFFFTVSYDDENLSDAGIWALKHKGAATLRTGSTAVELDSRLQTGDKPTLIVKKYASCFFGTDFLSRLNAQRIDTLIIVGCTTSGCVRATAVDALQYGIRPIVVSDAVGDRSQAAHDQSLFDLQAKYADVVNTAEVVRYLRERN